MTAIALPATLDAALEEIIRLRAQLARLEQRDGISDPLTGLKNRRYFDLLFMDEQRRAHREGRTLTLLLADVDQFQGYNAHYGFQEGELILKAVAVTLGGALNRPGDTCFRLDDDQFACLFVTSVERESMELAERIREQLAQYAIVHELNAEHGIVTLSLGLAFMRPDQEQSVEQACARAVGALQQARDQGGNRVAR